jgi:hypothetical protein
MLLLLLVMLLLLLPAVVAGEPGFGRVASPPLPGVLHGRRGRGPLPARFLEITKHAAHEHAALRDVTTKRKKNRTSGCFRLCDEDVEEEEEEREDDWREYCSWGLDEEAVW